MTQDLPRTVDTEPPAGARSYFNHKSLDDMARTALRARFASAEPFPHLVLDDFLNLDRHTVLDQFPGDGWEHWKRFQDAYQHQKRACGDIEVLPELFRSMIYELSSPSFLKFLEQVTGISALIPDPYLMGGGLHSSGPGGILAPHADFHMYGKLALHRRINVLVYFNPDWRAENGGCLELFHKGEKTPAASVTPDFGRMVMFATDDRSIHGFTTPIAQGRWRNSLALYYYTSEDTDRFSGDGDTYWYKHGAHRGARLAQLLAFKVLQHGAWTLSKYAHRLNPNLKPGSTFEPDR